MKYNIKSLVAINSNGLPTIFKVAEECYLGVKVKNINPQWNSDQRNMWGYKDKFYTVWLEDNRVLQVPKVAYVAEWVKQEVQE